MKSHGEICLATILPTKQKIKKRRKKKRIEKKEGKELKDTISDVKPPKWTKKAT